MRKLLVSREMRRHMLLTVTTACLAAALVSPLTGCRGKKKSIEDGLEKDTVAVTENTSTADNLRERAETLWQAKVDEDWATVFEFEPASKSESVSLEDFIAYCESEEPFRVHSAGVEEVLTEGEYGWVQLNVTTSMRRFPNAPPVDTVRWENWRWVDDAWMPVPPSDTDNYPESPELRDLEQEATLRARFDESWQARLERDWEKLYDYIDPRDRDEVDFTVFKDTHSLFEYLACDVHWVQAKNGSGIVRVTVHHKLNDPSLTKLPERDATVREEWVRYEDEWYLDVRR